jgi:MtfA peptidase
VIFRRRRGRPLPSNAEAVLRHHVSEWRYLSDDERAELTDGAEHYLRRISWEAANGFELNDEMCAAIAAQVSLMTLGFDHDPFTNVRAVVVHPRTLVTTAARPGPVAGVMTDEPSHLDGEAHHHQGPLVLSWPAVRADTRHHGTANNVVVHEFAHKLDMLDGVIDGAPPLVPAELREQWIEVCTREYTAIRAHREHLLRDYAGTTTGEFFAVASEAFFGIPEALAAQHRQLYELFAALYRQDPAGRRPPAVSAEAAPPHPTQP